MGCRYNSRTIRYKRARVILAMETATSSVIVVILSSYIVVLNMFYIRLQENENLIMTPFEKTLEFWRQLWRVIERRLP